MDTVGYVYSQIIPEATDPREIERILFGKDERISSRFIASYSTILGLYTHYGEGAFDLFRKSLSNFRRDEFGLTKSYQREEAQIRCRINFLQAAGFLHDYALTDKGKLAVAVNGYEIQTAELYYSRSLDPLTARQIPVVLAGLITEESRSRKGREGGGGGVRMRFDAEKVIYNLRRKEMTHGIATPIREMDLSLAMPVYAWAGGCSLNELAAFSVPEGDLVRILRMTVQLLRTLRDRLPDPVMSDRMHEALELINRDVVDAQAELEVG
jgi:superfamily II RNA helicase